MRNDEKRSVCLQLLLAESTENVIQILRGTGFWDDLRYWRYYGDVENNWGQSGNQQSLAEAALAEKIVNSVDARLTNECRMRGIDPASDAAPKSIRAAVARYFEDSSGEKMATGGLMEDWDQEKTRKIAQGITLSATGRRPEQLNLTIADCGEGQTPDRLPDTILSLSQSNKMYIPFVQGQFNQGGTGALRFCGDHNLQLVISRRNPELLPANRSQRDEEWCFSIVRRERPSGGRKNSVYTYLAPVGIDAGTDDRRGDVLSFRADEFPIFPSDDGPFDQPAPYGTAIKLYDFQYLGEKSNILRGKSLRSRLDLLLPEIALPVRLYEYRTDKRGFYLDVGSRRTTLSGLRRRLRDNPNVQPGFPVAVPLQPHGEKLIARIFAFVPKGSNPAEADEDEPNAKKKGRGGLRGYRKREGVVFVRNGQTQGSLPKDFFQREAVKMKPLADDLLVFVECDELSNDVREDLFMPSRDRLAETDFKGALVEKLEEAIHDCQELKDLRNQRQQERLSDRLKDDRPLTDVLQSLIKASPNLTALLQLGQRISSPFNTRPAGGDPKEHLKLEAYPTFFKLKGVDYGSPLQRDCPINQRMRLIFETDARDDYFTRPVERGSFDVSCLRADADLVPGGLSGPVLKKGIASVMVDLPDGVSEGDTVEFIITIMDSRAIFENRVITNVTRPAEKRSGGEGQRKNRTDKDGKERERPTQVAPPQIKRVYKNQWDDEGFDEFTALVIESIGYSSDESNEYYEFKINMDNTTLINEAKIKRYDRDQLRLLGEQYLYANVLIGLSLLLDHKQHKELKEEGVDEPVASVEERVRLTTRAIAPFIPALISLGASDFELNTPVEGLEETG